MTTAHVFIAASLDGYIARKDGDIGWLTPNGAEAEEHGFADFYAGVDGTIMGRGTYEKVRSFGSWPFQKPTIVLSRTLSDTLPNDQVGKVRVWNCSAPEALDRVAAEGWARAYVDGGQLIQSFLREGLVADMILTRIPVLLGAGLPLFGALPHDLPLRHTGTTSFPSGLVQSRYEIPR
jgi:dihydrofolate reductase